MKRLVDAIVARLILTVLYGACLILCELAVIVRFLTGRAGRAKSLLPPKPFHVMAIGTFYTKNWCRAHLLPLAQSGVVAPVTAIVDGPTERIEGIEYFQTSQRRYRICGRAFSKAIAAMTRCFRRPADLVVGYHLVPNGVIALLVAKWFGSRAAYQVTGGPVQLIGGGVGSENVLLRKLGWPSWWIERLAMAVARRFDLVVVRGEHARGFMEKCGIGQEVRIIPGGIDAKRFAGCSSDRSYDFVTVGRLVPVKQIDQFIRIVAGVQSRFPRVRAIIVGDGPERIRLEEFARELGVAEQIEFAGHVDDVERILKRSKVFLLTSQSEGLSIAMAEAMAAGVVPVVADVGDLSELVSDGVNGCLIKSGDIDAFETASRTLLEDSGLWGRMSAAARKAVLGYNDLDAVAEKWADALEATCGWPAWAMEPTRLPRSARRKTKRPSLWKLWEGTPRVVRNLISPAAGLVPPAWTLGRRFRNWLSLIQAVDRLPRDRVNVFALAHVRRICQHAYERSIFYRRQFDALGLRPADIRALTDLRRLPTIDRSTIRDHLDEMLTVPADNAGVEFTTTGGTSGAPMRFYIGTDRSAVEYAHLVSAWMRTGYRPTIAQAVLRGRIVAENRAGLRHEYDPILRRHYYSTFHLSEDNIRRYLDHIATIGPCYLHVYPSSLDMLSRFLLKRSLHAPGNILGILAGSEIVYADNRQRAERAFDVPYFSWYGHTEKLVFASECEESSDYHVSPTYGYCELLDADGQPIHEPGQRGEIVGTGFLNTIVPFIRYRTGDFATYVSDRCEKCGREQLILREIRGHRTQELLVGADGALIPWTALNMHDDTFDHVRRFQFLQTQPGRATLRVVPDSEFHDEDCRRVEESLKRKLQGNLVVQIEICDDIRQTVAGKTTYVDQRIKLDGVLYEEAAI